MPSFDKTHILSVTGPIGGPTQITASNGQYVGSSHHGFTSGANLAGTSTFSNTHVTSGAGISGAVISNAINKADLEPIMKCSGWSIGSPILNFYEELEDGLMCATLEPEPNISGIEVLRVQLLIAACNEGRDRSQFKPIKWIRSQNLERHFRFSQT